MPTATTRRRPAKSQAEPKPITIAPPLTPAGKRATLKPSMALRVRETVREQLRDSLDNFLDTGLPEEHRFMLSVFNDWEVSQGGGNELSLLDHEVPIYSSIQAQMDGKLLVAVDDEHMMRDVNAYITRLQIEKPYRQKPATNMGTDPETEISAQLFREIEIFIILAAHQDKIFVLRMLRHWYEQKRCFAQGADGAIHAAAKRLLDEYLFEHENIA